MSARLKIVVILSLGYTGTTWVNLVLGSRPRAFALGPPNKIIGLEAARASEACLVHGADCAFWPPFVRTWDRGENFFLQLAGHAGCDLIVTNNPREEKAWADLRHPDIDVRYLRVLRDGRANLVSYMRHHYPDEPVSVVQAMEEWLLPRWDHRDRQERETGGDCLRIRYEDMVSDFDATLGRIGDHLGVGYDDEARDYWRYDHHLPEGNSGTVDLMRRFQGMEGLVHKRRAYYAAAFERLRDTGSAVVVDDTWRDVLTRADRLAYDCIAGARHAAYGYERDRFTVDEVVAFLAANGRAPAADPALVEALRVQPHVVGDVVAERPAPSRPGLWARVRDAVTGGRR